MSHTYHEGLPDFTPNRILHDGCHECELRARNPAIALKLMDKPTFQRAWDRAYAWQKEGLIPGELECAVLETIWVVRNLSAATGVVAGEPVGIW
jgi:hypothetical protein